jgi:hypothetical protein
VTDIQGFRLGYSKLFCSKLDEFVKEVSKQEVSKFLSTKLGSILDVFSRLQEGIVWTVVTKLLVDTKLLKQGLDKEVATVFKEVEVVSELSVETGQPVDRSMVEEVLLMVE